MMREKNKYSIYSYREKDNKPIHPPYLELEKDISVEDLISIYYYLLYPDLDYAGEKHNYYEMFFCLNGKAKVNIDKEEFSLGEKKFIITKPNSFHTHLPDKTLLSSVSISFSAKGIDDELICGKVGTMNESMMNLLNLMLNEYINNFEMQSKYPAPYVKNIDLKNEYGYKQLLKDGLEMMLVLITRAFKNDKTEQKVDISKEEKEDQNEIIQYIKAHYKEKLPLKEICEKFNYSEGHLCRKFKAETGDTVVGFITKLRISAAMHLLFEKRSSNIEAIAFEVGFNDIQYFNKLFKKYVGMTPGKYRAEIRENKALHAQDVNFDVVKNV